MDKGDASKVFDRSKREACGSWSGSAAITLSVGDYMCMCVSKLCRNCKSELRQKCSPNNALARLCSFVTVAAASSQMQSLITSLPSLDIVMQASPAVRAFKFLLRLFELPTSERSARPTEPMSVGNASED